MFSFHSDYVPRVSGSHKEYDLHVRSWHLSALWRQNERVPHLPQGHRTSHPTLLERRAMATSLFSSHRVCCCSHKHLSCIRKALCVHAKLRFISVTSSLYDLLGSIFVQLTSVFLDYVQQEEEESCLTTPSFHFVHASAHFFLPWAVQQHLIDMNWHCQGLLMFHILLCQCIMLIYPDANSCIYSHDTAWWDVEHDWTLSHWIFGNSF